MATNKAAYPFFAAQNTLREIVKILQAQVLPNVDENVTGGSPEYAERVEGIIYDANELITSLGVEFLSVRNEAMSSRPL